MTRAMLLLGLSGCLTLDGFVFNGIPCSQIGPDTCDPDKPAFDRACVPCGEAYDWQRDYDWIPGTLGPSDSVRPVPQESVQNLTLELDGGTADAVFIAGHGDKASITLLYNHGNYVGIEHYQPRVRMLHEAGYSVFIWDYRGYGKTQPETFPTASEFMADARIARDAVDLVAPDPTKVVVYGYSLGALPGIEQATTRPGCALILEAPFTSMQRVAESATTLTLRDQMLSDGQFDNIEKLRRHEGPLLAMVGDNDRYFPPKYVLELAAQNPGPTETWVVPGAGHGLSSFGIPESGMRRYLDRIERFLSTTPCGM
jgi:uncharacterized protein